MASSSPLKKVRIGVLVTAIALSTLTASAAAVDVTGTLQLPRDLAPPAQPRSELATHYWEELNGFVATRPRRLDVARELSVVLLGELTEGERPQSRFRLQGGALMPATLVVQQGTELVIENTDVCSHELYAEGIDDFVATQTAPGHARNVPLPASGDFAIADKSYRHVRGHLHIVPDLVARAELDGAGRFRFADVPPGQYTLVVFYGARRVGEQNITVTDSREYTLASPVPVALTAPE